MMNTAYSKTNKDASSTASTLPPRITRNSSVAPLLLPGGDQPPVIGGGVSETTGDVPLDGAVSSRTSLDIGVAHQASAGSASLLEAGAQPEDNQSSNENLDRASPIGSSNQEPVEVAQQQQLSQEQHRNIDRYADDDEWDEHPTGNNAAANGRGQGVPPEQQLFLSLIGNMSAQITTSITAVLDNKSIRLADYFADRGTTNESHAA